MRHKTITTVKIHHKISSPQPKNECIKVKVDSGKQGKSSTRFLDMLYCITTKENKQTNSISNNLFALRNHHNKEIIRFQIETK